MRFKGGCMVAWLRGCVVIMAALLLSVSSEAVASDWVMSNHVKARIVAESNKFGVEMQTDAGWHTYYKDPGDAGIPTVFKWDGSRDIAVKNVVFPEPQNFDEYGIKTRAYEGNIFFPVEADFSGAPHVELKIEGAICKEICMAYSLNLAEDLPQGYKAAAQVPEKSYLFIMWIAFLAGLILNIMPCVLPVLSLKVLGVLRQSGVEQSRVRLNFAAASLGIIVSFWVLAILAIVFKNAGLAVGWGLHFQSPVFVGVLMVITLALALSLLGAFHLRAPSWIAGSGENNTVLGNFLSGVLATLLGTSCTAPVVVTAVGFALSGSAANIFALFTVMGLGMALPFIVFACRPQIATLLPKPGGWMIRVKHVMGMLLLATGVWLGFVLYEQVMPHQVIEKANSEWQVFDEKKIQGYVAEGKTVFVDVTASWCLNCKLNKVRVLDTDEMQKYFADNKIILMQGDMTKPSKILIDYIRRFDRYGIPFNQVYGPGAKSGVLLPTLLTKSQVVGAIQKAGIK